MKSVSTNVLTEIKLEQYMDNEGNMKSPNRVVRYGTKTGETIAKFKLPRVEDKGPFPVWINKVKTNDEILDHFKISMIVPPRDPSNAEQNSVIKEVTQRHGKLWFISTNIQVITQLNGETSGAKILPNLLQQ